MWCHSYEVSTCKYRSQLDVPKEGLSRPIVYDWLREECRGNRNQKYSYQSFKLGPSLLFMPFEVVPAAAEAKLEVREFDIV